MAVSSLTTVFCDGCGAWVDEGIASTASEARAQLVRAGWRTRMPDFNTQGDPCRRDWCPRCKHDRRPGAGFE